MTSMQKPVTAQRTYGTRRAEQSHNYFQHNRFRPLTNTVASSAAMALLLRVPSEHFRPELVWWPRDG